MNELMFIGSLVVYAVLIIGACRLGKEFVFVFGAFNIVASNAVAGYEIQIFGFTTLWIVSALLHELPRNQLPDRILFQRDAVKYVLNMAGMQLLFYLFILTSGWLTLEGDGKYKEAVDVVFAATPRVTLAACLSHILLFIDAQIYKFFKDKEGQGWYGQLWFRATLSALVTHFLLTILFFCVAFYGTMPNEILVSIIISNLLIKYALSFAETPLMYVARFCMRGKPKDAAV